MKKIIFSLLFLTPLFIKAQCTTPLTYACTFQVGKNIQFGPAANISHWGMIVVPPIAGGTGMTSLPASGNVLMSNGTQYVPMNPSDVFFSKIDTLTTVMTRHDADSAITSINTSLGLKANTSSLHTIATSGSYNDLSNKPTIPIYTAGTGIGVSGGVITNSAPDQTVSITGGNGITVTGTYPNFTVSKTKRQEPYSGTTSGSGTYTVTFGTSYSSAPNIQANIIGATDTQNIRITSISTTGFTVTVRNRTDVAGLLPTWSNVNGAIVDVLITEK